MDENGDNDNEEKYDMNMIMISIINDGDNNYDNRK